MDGYEPESRQQHSSGWLLKFLALTFASSLTLLAMVTAFGMWRTGNRFFQQVEALYTRLTAAQPTAQADVRSLVVQQVQGASELTTTIFAMQAIVPASRDRTVAGYVIGKTTLLYIGYGEVRAGVDLSQIDASDVQVEGETVSLRLPPPQILDSKIDVNRSEVYDYDRGFLALGPDAAPELQSLAQRETLKKIVETACNEGVLEDANQRAASVVSQLLNGAGYANFSVTTQPPPPGTCLPAQTVAPVN